MSDAAVKLSAEVRAWCVLAPRITVAVAESLTCGRVQSLLGAAPGASDYFLGGISAYTIAQKVALLGVDAREAKRVNAVSAEIALQMARGAAVRFGARLTLATTGYAQPSPDNEVVEPFAWWALVHRRPRGLPVERTGRVFGPGLTRVQMQMAVAEAAVAELAEYLRAGRG